MTKETKRRVSREQRLRDDVAYAASCLKEAGDPLCHLGPSGRYADAFERYSDALRTLLGCSTTLLQVKIEEWSWDAYDGSFHFRWSFGAQVRELGADKDYETQYVGMYTYARLYDSKPLDEELARLRAEAEHFHAMRNGVMQWATAVHAKGKRP